MSPETLSAGAADGDEARLDFAGHAFPVEGLGPGRRNVIWVRGCPLACPGCMTPELWQPADASSHMPISQVAAKIAPTLAQSDGLTISGGEPFEQPVALTQLIRLLRCERDVEVMVYSGYSLEELRRRGQAAAVLLDEIDLLMDSRFVENASNTLQWRGSDNQRMHLLSDRAQKHEAAREAPMAPVRPLQIQTLETGRYRLIGIPRRGDFAAYRAALLARGVEVAAEAVAVPGARNGKRRKAEPPVTKKHE